MSYFNSKCFNSSLRIQMNVQARPQHTEKPAISSSDTPNKAAKLHFLRGIMPKNKPGYKALKHKTNTKQKPTH